MTIYHLDLSVLRTLKGDSELFILEVRGTEFKYIASNRLEVIKVTRMLYNLLSDNSVTLINTASGKPIPFSKLDAWAYEKLGW